MNELESKVLRLVSPYTIEEKSVSKKIKKGWVVIEPTIGSVCHADLRYYTGSRRPEVLARKLPMALIHEGIGVVKESKDEKFYAGDRVVIVPNIPGTLLNEEIREDSDIPSNYSNGNAFLGSGYDGIAQSRLIHPAACLVKIPDSIPDEIAVLAELSSVSYHAISHIEDVLEHPETKIALFGDGPVGYLTSAMVRYLYGAGSDRFTVFGADESKLAHFSFAHQEMVQNYDFTDPSDQFDVVLECTGGKFSESAINQAITIAKPIASIVLMGVTEERVPINTRDVLEKGITLYGSSRSTTADFEKVIHAMEQTDYQEALKKILPPTWNTVTDALSFKTALDGVLAEKPWTKTVLDFRW